MDKNELLSCIDFFNKLNISVEDVTTEDERNNNQLCVIATYKFENKEYRTERLYYKNILNQRNVKKASFVTSFFKEPVYWLDIDEHDWPEGKGAKLNNIVVNEIAGVNNIDFKIFLSNIANDNKDGFEQQITWDGRSAQYGLNLENNNHWHDIILLIKKIIESNGKEVDKKYFNKLVFEWDSNQRTSLHTAFGSRAIINSLYKNIQSIQKTLKMENTIDLLNYKKQIILQGPPGTGKTRMAKEIARKMTKPSKIDLIILKEFISKIKIGEEIRTISDRAAFKILEIKEDRLVYQRESTNEIGDLLFKDILFAFENKKWESVKNGSDTYSAPIAKLIFDKIESENVKLIQFHPAYSYEDFVRGISVEVNNGLPEYITKNKILGEFAQKANNNFLESQKAPEQLSEERWLAEEIKKFAEIVEEDIVNKGSYILNDSVSLYAVDDDCFRYTGKNWDLKNKYRMKFSDIIQAQINNVQDKQDYKKLRKIGIISGRSWQHSSYDLIVLNKFRVYLGERKAPVQVESVKLENYVLIIDEINRANLPAVLGELIYALEYRNHPVESMYDLDGDNTLTLPPNLYIIGTMNTADRSVGHIDYAIRRRFSFVDVLPSLAPIRNVGKEYFKTVSSLFIKNFDEIDWSSPKLTASEHLASDFKPEDVWLGHSYFITKEKDENGNTLDENLQMSMKLKYEIVPILKEYVKDGILQETEAVKTIINDLIS